MKFAYIGSGFVIGIPARNLNDDEAKEIGITRIKKSGLYREIKIRRAVEIPPQQEEQQWQTE